MLEADLASLALELAVWGVADPAELLWLDQPPVGAYAQARELLGQLGVLREDGTLTPHGKRVAEFGLHPRLAHMVLMAEELGLGAVACEIAALLGERDILRGGGPGSVVDADLRHRVEVLRAVRLGRHMGDVDVAAVRRILAEADRWKRTLSLKNNEVKQDDVDACGLLLAFAYPDRIAQRRGNGRYLLRNGRGAAFAEVQALSKEPYLVAAELDDRGVEGRIFLAAPVGEDELRAHVAEQIEEQAVVKWDRSTQSVRGWKRERLGALLLKETVLLDPGSEDVLAALLEGVAEQGLEKMLNWTKAARQYRERLAFMHRYNAEWPDVSDAALLDTMEEWLAPHVYGMRSRDELMKIGVIGLLESLLSWDQRRALDEQMPTHVTVPSGSRVPVDYSDPVAPVLAVRLQELFGLKETPRIANGKVPLVLHLLSPASRPVQVTRDLASFWRDAYFEVKKDLKGRYPKHDWPDDPMSAVPTNRVKPRG